MSPAAASLNGSGPGLTMVTPHVLGEGWGSGLNQFRCAERCGDGVGISGTREDIHGGVGELDHVRVAVLDRGRKIAEGSPGEVQRHPDVIRAYLGTAKERREVAAA